MLEHLKDEREKALVASSEFVASGKFNDAALSTGGMLALDLLWVLLHPPRREEKSEDPPWVDPAAIRRPVK